MDASDLASVGMGGLLGTSIGPTGIANNIAAQNQAYGAQASQANIWQTPQVTKSHVAMQTGGGYKAKSRVELMVHIVEAENGFVVNVGQAGFGHTSAAHIAATMEDITTIVTSQLASRMLDRTER